MIRYKGAHMKPNCMHAKRTFQKQDKKKLEVRHVVHSQDVFPEHTW